jgi:hypothetical protein
MLAAVARSALRSNNLSTTGVTEDTEAPKTFLVFVLFAANS